MRTIILSVFFLTASIQPVPQQLVLTNKGEIVEEIETEKYAIPYLDHTFLDIPKLQALVEQLDKKVHQNAVDATLDKNGKIIPEKNGIALDQERFLDDFHEFFYQGATGEVEVPIRRIYPRVDSELLTQIREKELGKYATYFKPGNKERTHNIKLASEAINNYVIFPGETFSFNKVVGKRTKERGYMKAPVIVKGEFAEDIGGGICQTSSTLYNAVDLDGVKILERYSHSRSVPYVPPGRDATVSWYGPDFVFQNKYNQPLLIRASAENGKMIVEIFSSNEARAKE